MNDQSKMCTCSCYGCWDTLYTHQKLLYVFKPYDKLTGNVGFSNNKYFDTKKIDIFLLFTLKKWANVLCVLGTG